MSAPSNAQGRRSWLPVAGVVVAVWAMVPRFAGPELNTSDRVEIADHVVPGVVLLAVAAVGLALALAGPGRRPGSGSGRSGTAMFVSGLVVVLAGLWMTATHVPLLAQASRDEVTWGAAAFHTAPGIAVLLLGVAWVVAYWAEAAPTEPAGPA